MLTVRAIDTARVPLTPAIAASARILTVRTEQ
jgi:hypothetical protein